MSASARILVGTGVLVAMLATSCGHAAPSDGRAVGAPGVERLAPPVELADEPPGAADIGPADPPPERAPALEPCCGEGRLSLYVMAKTAFTGWTQGEHWEWMDRHYDEMVVWDPYWESRLLHYDEVAVYRNAYAIKVSGRDTRAVDHPEWILRSASGAPVYIPYDCDRGCPQYAADVGNPEYRAHWIETAAELLDAGYRGLYIDDVNYRWRLSGSRGEDIVPVDPRTGEALTLADWRQYLTEFLEQIRAAFPDVPIWHNVIWYADSPTFDDPLIDRQLAAADVVQLERGMNDRGLEAGSGRYGMESFLAFVDRVHAQGTQVAMLDENAVDAGGQWYNIAGALLVNDGGDFVTTEDWDLISPTGLFPGFLTDLGDALGPRRIEDGTIRREFTGGLVVLRQPGAQRVTVELDGQWSTPQGDLVTSVALSGAEAAVLRRP